MKHFKLSLVFLFFFLSNTFIVFSQTEPIFEIKNDAGQTVFAVYPGGVKIFVDDQLKATGGGFTVGRIGTEKATGGDIFSVNPNDVRVNIDDALKATGGGFTVGRIGTEKATTNDYFSVQPNDVRVIINDAGGLKATGGGFTVGRIGTEKATGGDEDFLKVTPDSTRVYIDSSSTAGFAVGRLGSTKNTNFLDLTPDNYFIGQDVAPNITTGKLNSVFGYNAGYSLTTGSDNIFIGNKAGFNTGSGISGGNENIFIGNEAGYNSTTPVRNVFIGHEAGHENVSGQYNTYIGNMAARNGKGFYNTILGGLAANTNNFGNSNVVIGYVAGRDMVSGQNVYIGQGAGYNNSGTEGGNVFIGYYAGESLSAQDHRLAIGSDRSKPPLIYGEFDNQLVNINGGLQVNGEVISPSDKRLKTDFIKLTKGLDIVKSLNGYYFSWNTLAINQLGFKDKKQIGLIAQEVEKLVPEIVFKSTNGYKAIDYSKISAVLVEAIKEQQKIIEKLESRINQLEEKNDNLKAEVSEIQDMKAEINELKTLVKGLVDNHQAEKSDSESAK